MKEVLILFKTLIKEVKKEKTSIKKCYCTVSWINQKVFLKTKISRY